MAPPAPPFPSADIRVEALRPERRDDFLRFFDHERGLAFSDNPQWAKCYCHFYHVPENLDWAAFDADANRTAMRARIEVGEMEGFLAYAGDTVVGWVNAQPLNKLPHCWGRMGVPLPAADLPLWDMAAIVCFVIAPQWRRRGVARALLKGALANLRDRGVRRVYAFPFNAANDLRPAAHYHGPASLFREAGFVQDHVTADLALVRLDMAAQ